MSLSHIAIDLVTYGVWCCVVVVMCVSFWECWANSWGLTKVESFVVMLLNTFSAMMFMVGFRAYEGFLLMVLVLYDLTWAVVRMSSWFWVWVLLNVVDGRAVDDGWCLRSVVCRACFWTRGRRGIRSALFWCLCRVDGCVFFVTRRWEELRMSVGVESTITFILLLVIKTSFDLLHAVCRMWVRIKICC